MTWRVGDRAKWLGVQPVPGGATWNPPPPGWKPPTAEERAHMDKLCRNMRVTVLRVDFDGIPDKVEAEDGFVFDPSVHPDLLKPASHEGWEDDRW